MWQGWWWQLLCSTRSLTAVPKPPHSCVLTSSSRHWRTWSTGWGFARCGIKGELGPQAEGIRDKGEMCPRCANWLTGPIAPHTPPPVLSWAINLPVHCSYNYDPARYFTCLKVRRPMFLLNVWEEVGMIMILLNAWEEVGMIMILLNGIVIMFIANE